MRLGNDPKFVIDSTKFDYKWRYYGVLKHLGRDIDSEQLQKELFESIASYIKNAEKHSHITQDRLEWLDVGYCVSVQQILDISIAIREFGEMGFRDEVLFFYEWDAKIRNLLNERLEERYAETQCMLSMDDIWLLYCSIARRNFPEKYAYMVAEDPRRIERRKEMIDELKPFIKQLGLEVEEDEDEDLCRSESRNHLFKYPFSTPTIDDAPF